MACKETNFGDGLLSPPRQSPGSILRLTFLRKNRIECLKIKLGSHGGQAVFRSNTFLNLNQIVSI